MKKFEWPEPPSTKVFPLAMSGLPIIFASAFVTAIFALLGLTLPALICLVVTLFICYFFRDPDRLIPMEPQVVVSPADGKVIVVQKKKESSFFDGPCLKISIFMTIFNVHVNRMPCEGRVERIDYFPGKFFGANTDKGGKTNEKNALFIKTNKDVKVSVVQVAGLVARRIICYVKKEDTLKRGQRFGLICFGSRLDIYLPENSKPIVAVGDKVQAGTSVLAKLP